MTREELAARVTQEGGIWEAFFFYGITVEDLPDDVPADIEEACHDLQKAVTVIGTVAAWLFPREP